MTTIEWTDVTWNPVTGCTKISEGCENCYAERMAKRLRGRCGYPKDEPFKVTLHHDRLVQPLRWRKAKRVFVCSMGDLFHEDVPNSYIQAVFTVMARCWQHTFQILTKRPSRILEIISIWVNNGLTLREGFGAVLPPNVWLGVSVENQKTSEERIPLLLQTPAAVRFVSAEPLLGNIYLNHLEYEAISEIDSLRGTHGLIRPHSGKCNKLDWVIVGAESGPRRRECDNQWIARIVKQCVDSNTPVFVKQAHEGRKVVKMPKIMGRVWDGMP